MAAVIDGYLPSTAELFAASPPLEAAAARWDGQLGTFASTFESTVFLDGPPVAFYTVPSSYLLTTLTG